VFGTIARQLALSYLLPSGILFHQLAVQQSEQLPASFEVAGTVNLTGDEAHRAAAALGLQPADPLAIPMKLGFSSGRCNLQIVGSGGPGGAHSISIVNDRGQVSGGDPGWAAWMARLGCLPFLFRGESGSSAEVALRKAGGIAEEAALTFEDGSVAYVLGAGEAGTGKTGLVVKKRGLLPLRAWEEEGGSRVEVAFLNYREVFHRGGFPTAIELRSNGLLIARFAAAP
jgi:hypothetical protein